uniref:Armadillo repeat-containing protein 8 n=1 Tax=Aureoumbra lagunensis TaxID=44058 RepID=A0A7S3K1Q9_9STRA
MYGSIDETTEPNDSRLQVKCRRATKYVQEVMATSAELVEEEESHLLRRRRSSFNRSRSSEAESVLETFRSDVEKIDKLTKKVNKNPISITMFKRRAVNRKLDLAMGNMRGALGVLRIVNALEHCDRNQRIPLTEQLVLNCAQDYRRALAARAVGAIPILLNYYMMEENRNAPFLKAVDIIIASTTHAETVVSVHLMAIDDVAEIPQLIDKKLIDTLLDDDDDDDAIRQNKESAIYAANILRYVAGARPRYADVIAKAGAILPLCFMLDVKDTAKSAAKALWNICHNCGHQFRSAIRARRAVFRLAALIQYNQEECSVAALGCLANLALDHQAKTEITVCTTPNNIPLLELVMNDILAGHNEQDSWPIRAKVQAVALLCNIQIESNHHRLVVARRGGVGALVHTLLSSIHLEDQQLKEVTARALQQLALNYQSKVAIAKAGAIPPLLNLIANHSVNSENIQSAAALALMTLVHDNVKIEFEIGSVHGIYILTKFLRRAVTEAAKETSAGVLCRLASDPISRDRMAYRAIPGLVNVLKSAITDPPITAAATCLWKIALQDYFIPDIIKAGAVRPLCRAIDHCESSAQQAAAGVLKEMTSFPSAQNIIINFWHLDNILLLPTRDRSDEDSLDVIINERAGIFH